MIILSEIVFSILKKVIFYIVLLTKLTIDILFSIFVKNILNILKKAYNY